MTKNLKMEYSVDIKIKEGFLTEELMDNYERYFFELTDGEYSNLSDREERHIANIADSLLRGESNFIEGYGCIDDFVEKFDVYLVDVEAN